ncbi:hypothetical protein U729_3248 (plasmid) [Clostridium baratii str. Sullivan]|uniref:Uncharacterized protein n=1 Tax=Clostridium baratii str. Sullivan TaxID=1415775 RepID=A0A0A7G0A4_9CLOT|nr:hypothetical protein [Clostridium baratii]AIY85284.1 hypothetical protein U729_3248 [Clostridium baratii str. Sullivan]
MGQYFKVVNLTKKEVMQSNLDDGTKFFEHSFINNPFMNRVMELIGEDGPWYKDKIIWCGDYAMKGLFTNDKGINLFIESASYKDLEFYENPGNNFRYLVNDTCAYYIDLTKCPKCRNGLTIHPLPLLTSTMDDDYRYEYCGFNAPLNGLWCGDSIYATNNKPEKYVEIVPNFIY